MHDQPLLPFQIGPTVFLRLTGRWSEGGAAEVFVPGQGSKRIDLPRGPWALLALMMLAAQDSKMAGWGSAFVTTQELTSQLAKKTGLGRWDASNIYRLVLKLRKRLAQSGAHEMTPQGLTSGGREWAKHLIEKQQYLGYRVSLPPKNLELVILEDRLYR